MAFLGISGFDSCWLGVVLGCGKVNVNECSAILRHWIAIGRAMGLRVPAAFADGSVSVFDAVTLAELGATMLPPAPAT